MANTHSFLQPASFKDVNIFHHRLYNNSTRGSSFLPPNAHMATCFPDHTPEAKAERCCRASSSDASLGPSRRLPETAGGARPGEPRGPGRTGDPPLSQTPPISRSAAAATDRLSGGILQNFQRRRTRVDGGSTRSGA